MKKFLRVVSILILVFNSKYLYAQNAMINVVTKNSGIVKKDEIVYFEITINNTSPTASIPAYKLRPQISFPTKLVDVPTTGHVLPNNWTITSNKNGVIFLSNGNDVIAENENRVILIAIKGKKIGGPSSIIGNLTFSDGIAPGTNLGAPLLGDNIADNASTSSITIVK